MHILYIQPLFQKTSHYYSAHLPQPIRCLNTQCHGTIDWLWTTHATPIPHLPLPHKKIHLANQIPHSPTIPPRPNKLHTFDLNSILGRRLQRHSRLGRKLSHCHQSKVLFVPHERRACYMTKVEHEGAEWQHYRHRYRLGRRRTLQRAARGTS